MRRCRIITLGSDHKRLDTGCELISADTGCRPFERIDPEDELLHILRVGFTAISPSACCGHALKLIEPLPVVHHALRQPRCAPLTQPRCPRVHVAVEPAHKTTDAHIARIADGMDDPGLGEQSSNPNSPQPLTPSKNAADIKPTAFSASFGRSGDEENRTLDLLHAMQALYQLSYVPKLFAQANTP